MCMIQATGGMIEFPGGLIFVDCKFYTGLWGLNFIDFLVRIINECCGCKFVGEGYQQNP